MKPMIKHTPGPWQWDEMDGRIYVTPEGRPCHYIADINSKATDPEGDYPRKPQREANARLIAAAPDMLELIRYLANTDEDECVYCADESWYGEGHTTSCLVGCAQTVLAAIEGRKSEVVLHA